MKAARPTKESLLPWIVVAGAFVSTSTASGQWIPLVDLDPADSMVYDQPYRTLNGRTVGTARLAGGSPEDLDAGAPYGISATKPVQMHFE